MITAKNSSGQTILIYNAKKGEPYYCPICGQLLEQKRGEVRTHHFAHKRTVGSQISRICSDNWHYDMTEWHIEWQKRFPEDCIEKVMIKDKQKHIADVAINGQVIEFQHSPISIEDFRARNAFYKDCGYQVIWVFDLKEEWDNKRISNVGWNRYTWAYAKKLFREMDYKTEGVSIYFQFSYDEGDEDYVLERITGAYRGFSQFYTDMNHTLSIPDFVRFANQENQPLNPRKREEIRMPESVNGGETIFSLWKSNYQWMVVRNLVNGKEMLIKGANGEMDVQNGQPGNIVGRYSNIGANGRYKYSKQQYVVWDADKPIWKLKKAMKLTGEMI